MLGVPARSVDRIGIIEDCSSEDVHLLGAVIPPTESIASGRSDIAQWTLLQFDSGSGERLSLSEDRQGKPVIVATAGVGERLPCT